MNFIKEFWSEKKKDFIYLGYALLVVYLSIIFSEFDKVKSDENLLKYSIGIILGYIIIWSFSLAMDLSNFRNKKTNK